MPRLSALRPHRSLLVATAALAALLALLAVLQYRWLGQVGEADAARLRSGARARGDELAKELDREITLAFVWLRVEPEEGAFTRRWKHWSSLAAYPRVVLAVGLVRNGSYLRFVPSTGVFEPAEWPRSAGALRVRLAAWSRPPRAPEPGGSGPGGPLDPDVPALFSPVLDIRPPRPLDRTPWPPSPPDSFNVVMLDDRYLREELLPALVLRHFAPSGDSDYGVRVDRRDRPAEVVFTTDPAIPPDGPVDVTVGLFGIHPERLGALEREGLPWLAGRTASRRPGSARPEPEAFESGHWRLLVRHRAGSVQAVVAKARRRNLAISGGILALLAVSAGLVVLAAQRAHRLADRQLEFVAGVSHELRTPVAAICAAGDNLSAGLVADLETARSYGGVIRAEGRRLADMVERVLDLAGTYSGRRKWRLEPVSLAPLLREVCASVEPSARERRVRIDSRVDGELPPVRAERAALGRAVANLLDNALLHGGDGGLVTLRAGAAGNGREATVRIGVEDRGHGIPPSEVAHLFEPFFRGREAAERQTRGSGLGLSLVQRIVDAHGGRIEVATGPGRGTVFTIVLPALAEERR